MIDLYQRATISQFDAALSMIADCIDRCPDNLWDAPIAKYPFWCVTYHVLCYVDVYLERRNEDWQPQPAWHPAGRAELEEEYPTRRFERAELRAYVDFCRQKMQAAITAETAETLAGPSGFAHLPIPRAELHAYNLRHLSGHLGQLTAHLHRAGLEVRWVKAGAR